LNKRYEPIDSLGFGALQYLGEQESVSFEEFFNYFHRHPLLAQLLKDFHLESLQTKTDLIYSFTHKSFVHEYPGLSLNSYERLEFLGDSVLNLCIAEILYKKFPQFSEGDLSKFRGSLVNEEILSRLAQVLGLEHFILMGKGEIKEEANRLDSILADVMESFIGMVFKETSYEKTYEMIEQLLLTFESETGESLLSRDRVLSFDSKSRLQEKTMALYQEVPDYRSSELKDKNYLVELYIRGKKMGEVVDSSKKRAEKKLAEMILKENKFKG
jgi:ribonuclease III